MKCVLMRIYVEPSFEVIFLYSIIWQLASLQRIFFSRYDDGSERNLELWIDVRMQDKFTIDSISLKGWNNSDIW